MMWNKIVPERLEIHLPKTKWMIDLLRRTWILIFKIKCNSFQWVKVFNNKIGIMMLFQWKWKKVHNQGQIKTKFLWFKSLTKLAQVFVVVKPLNVKLKVLKGFLLFKVLLMMKQMKYFKIIILANSLKNKF